MTSKYQVGQRVKVFKSKLLGTVARVEFGAFGNLYYVNVDGYGCKLVSFADMEPA